LRVFFKDKNFNILLKGIIRNANSNIVALFSLLYFNGYPKVDPTEFFIALEENVKENKTKVKIRENFLEYNIDNINKSYQKLIEMISSIKNRYYLFKETVKNAPNKATFFPFRNFNIIFFYIISSFK